LAAAHKAQLVILLLDENSRSPQRMEEKISLALQLRELAFSAGLPLDDLIFDPFLVNLSWPDAFLQVAETVKTVRMLASGALFQEPVKTMVGLSNLRSGVRRHTPQQVEEICLGLLAGAGLWSVLANALDAELVKAWRLMEQMSQEAAD
jgi:cobalamin-dependent methionine synthase I